MASVTMGKNKRTVFAAIFITCAMLPVLALGQTLPWQTSPSGQPSSSSSSPDQSSAPPAHHHHHGQNANSPTAAPGPAANSQRSEDDRKLNLLATKFYGITTKDPEIIPKLKKLEVQVKDFSIGLSSRGYDASDILNDTKHLESRIAHQRKELEAKAAQSAPVASSPPPPPPPPPPASVPKAAAPAVPGIGNTTGIR